MKSNSTTPRTDAREKLVDVTCDDSCAYVAVRLNRVEYPKGIVDSEFARELELENVELLEALKKAERELSRLFQYMPTKGILPSPSVMQDCAYVIHKLTQKQ